MPSLIQSITSIYWEYKGPKNTKDQDYTEMGWSIELGSQSEQTSKISSLTPEKGMLDLNVCDIKSKATKRCYLARVV